MSQGDDRAENLLEALERRARDAAPEDAAAGEDQAPDLIAALRETEGPEPGAGAAPPDLTLQGYVERHDRPPAFTGCDEQPYTVAVDVEPAEDGEAAFAAFFVFVRWAATGAGIMGHVESTNVAYGDTEEEAREAAMKCSLYEVKEKLDAAIERRRAALED